MGALTASQAALGLYGTYAGAENTKAQAEYQAGVADVNAKMAEGQAREAESVGYAAAQKVGRKVAEMRGAQQVALADAGLDPKTGTPATLVDAAGYFGGIDVQTTASNAGKSAWGYEQEAENYRSAGRSYRRYAGAQNPMLAAGLSLIGSTGDIAEKWVKRPQAA